MIVAREARRLGAPAPLGVIACAASGDLPRVLEGHGYRTGCFSSSHLTFSGRLQQLQQVGFQRIDRPARSGSRYVQNPWGVDDRRVFDKVRAFLSESDRPAFALGVTVGSHYPYTHAVPGLPDDPDPARRYLAAITSATPRAWPKRTSTCRAC